MTSPTIKLWLVCFSLILSLTMVGATAIGLPLVVASQGHPMAGLFLFWFLQFSLTHWTYSRAFNLW